MGWEGKEITPIAVTDKTDLGQINWISCQCSSSPPSQTWVADLVDSKAVSHSALSGILPFLGSVSLRHHHHRAQGALLFPAWGRWAGAMWNQLCPTWRSPGLSSQMLLCSTHSQCLDTMGNKEFKYLNTLKRLATMSKHHWFNNSSKRNNTVEMKQTLLMITIRKISGYPQLLDRQKLSAYVLS